MFEKLCLGNLLKLYLQIFSTKQTVESPKQQTNKSNDSMVCTVHKKKQCNLNKVTMLLHMSLSKRSPLFSLTTSYFTACLTPVSTCLNASHTHLTNAKTLVSLKLKN